MPLTLSTICFPNIPYPLGELITAIRNDIAFADRELSSSLLQQWADHLFLRAPVADLQQPGAVDTFNATPLGEGFCLPLAVMDHCADSDESPAPYGKTTPAAKAAKENSEEGVEVASNSEAPHTNAHMSNGHGS